MSKVKRFTATVQGRKVECLEVEYRKYANGLFSSGLAKGLPYGDNYYIRNEVKGKEPWFLFLRHDEALTLIELAAAALWAKDNLKRLKK